MRLISRKYDSEFDPVVTLVGLGFLAGGVDGVALLSPAMRDPVVWILAGITLVMGVMGSIILERVPALADAITPWPRSMSANALIATSYQTATSLVVTGASYNSRP